MRPKGTAASVAAREAGSIYQSRWYWLESLRLLAPAHRVERVAFERSEDRHFDDVVTMYGKRYRHRGLEVEADYSQLKFHVASESLITWEKLMDPSFMGSSSKTSLIQRLLETYPGRTLGRFALITPWQIDSRDLLSRAHLGGYGGALRIDDLIAGDSSQLTALQQHMLFHTSAKDASELHGPLSRLVIHHGKSLDVLTQLLDDRLAIYGLPGIGPDPGSKYDAFLFGLLQDEKVEWTSNDLRRILADHFDWEGPPKGINPSHRLGIKQFDRFAEYIEDHVDEMLDLRPFFEERHIDDPDFWQSKVLPALRTFTADFVDGKTGDIELHIAGVTSVAYTFGALIHPKTPVRFLFAQSGQRFRETWLLEDTGEIEGDPLTQEIVRTGEGQDLAVAISITRDVREDVLSYVKAHPNIGRVMYLNAKNIGQSSVRNGAHARAIGESAARHIERHSTIEYSSHLFISAPNSVTFSIGRASARIARVVLYEFPFETPGNRTYTPSISIERNSK